MAFNWTESRRRLCLHRLEKWEGTPHRHRRAEMGVGIDCVNLVIDTLKKAGAIPADFTVPPYARNVGFMADTNTALEAFEGAFFTKRVDPEDIAAGDVIFFHELRANNHVGICMGPDVFHCLWSAGVVRSPLSDVRAKAWGVLRITKSGVRKHG